MDVLFRDRRSAGRSLRQSPAFAAVVSSMLACSVGGAEWRDPSPHRAELVSLEQTDVRLEVLDWGGTGRPLVLLAGGGTTAHIFDEFAPRLTDVCHVYGITRRGFGASSRPASGYDDQRLADDVLAVLDGLKIVRPVLMGHSMGGGEMTTLANQHSDRLSGLVYLDAIADPGDSMRDPAFVELLNKLPSGMREPPTMDPSSFAAYRASQARAGGGAFPESELRQLFAATADGGVGRYIASTTAINSAIGAGQIRRDYSRIRVPVLALNDYPLRLTDARRVGFQPTTDEERRIIEQYLEAEMGFVDRRSATLKRGVPSAKIVNLPGAGHFVFLTKPDEVVREAHSFVADLR
jgi:pimeloyl-ACP methyl ester carboxylesterase